MRFIFFIINGILLMGLFFACNGNKKQKTVEDNFYTKSNSSWDANRIPLAKPYELLRLNGSKEWSMNLQAIPGSVSNVQEVNVVQNIILIHSGETYCNNAKVQEAWFIIIPEKHIEKGFEKKEDFEKYASSLHVAPKLYDVNSVDDFFSRNKKLNWQEGLK